MKNILLFIIDSLNYSHLKTSKVPLMPFLEELEERGISCENMFSEAPYTEAAVMNIYCSEDVLENGGYLFRFKDAPKTIFEAMKEKGYETYYNSYQPQCHPSSVRRGVDHLYYNVGYDQEALWSYRMAHYSSVYKNGDFKKKDEEDLEEIFDDNFKEWIRFTDDLIQKDSSVELIAENASSYDAALVKEQVEAEYKKYKEEKAEYIQSVLEQGKNHPFFKLPAFAEDRKIQNREYMKEAAKELKPLLSGIRRMQFQRNMRNAMGSLCKAPFGKLGNCFKHPSSRSFKDFLKSGYGALNGFLDLDLSARTDSHYDSFKNAPSARTHIDHYLKYAKEQKGKTPHFACIHVDDVHNPEVFFTYDQENPALLKEEIAEAYDVLRQIPKDYYGNITHDLSLRYIDNVLKYLFKGLESIDLLDDTEILICADHGFSFSGNPIRDSYVVNLYLENYNIPFVVWGKDLPHERITNLRESKDIPATICDLADGKIPECFSGRSVLEEEGAPCCRIEYCGGGCPDLRRRELKIAAFTKDYFVGTLGTLSDFSDAIVSEIYDLQKDPLQKHNLAKESYDHEQAEPLLLNIKERKEALLKNL